MKIKLGLAVLCMVSGLTPVVPYAIERTADGVLGRGVQGHVNAENKVQIQTLTTQVNMLQSQINAMKDTFQQLEQLKTQITTLQQSISSYSNIANTVNALNSSSQSTSSAVNALARCNQKGMVYQPGAGADAEGCRHAASSAAGTAPCPGGWDGVANLPRLEHGAIYFGTTGVNTGCGYVNGGFGRLMYQCQNGSMISVGCTTFGHNPNAPDR